MNASAPGSTEPAPFFGRKSTIRRKATTWIVVLGTTALAATGLHRLGTAAADARATKPEPAPPVAVRVVTLAEEPLRSALRYSGTVKELRKVALSFRVPGTVERLHRVEGPDGRARDLDAGDVIAEGTEIARLDPADYERDRALAAERLAVAEARVAAAVSEAEVARTDSARLQKLSRQGHSSREETDAAVGRERTTAANLLAARREVESARVQLRQAEANLSYCTLRVPFPAATVSARRVDAGERVTAGQEAFLLVDVSSVEVAFGVPDTLVGRLAIGQTLEATCDAFPDRTFPGVVSKIAGVADPQTRTYPVEVQIDDPSGLRPGMVATVTIRRERSAHLLPLTALTRGDTPDGLVAYRVEAEGDRLVARRRPVVLEGILDNRAAIRPEPGGLQPGDRVVATGTARLHDGGPVAVVDDASPILTADRAAGGSETEDHP